MTKLAFLTLLTTAAFFPTAPVQAQTKLDWSVTYSTPGRDAATCAVADANGNVFVAGTSDGNFAATAGSAFVAAYSAAGASLWTAWYDSTLGGGEMATSIALDGQGGVYVTGWAKDPLAIQRHAAFLMRVDAAGTVLWSVEQAATEGPGTLAPLLVDGLGRAVFGGRSPSNAGDMSIAAYTAAGALAWEVSYAGLAGFSDETTALTLAPNGDVIGVGNIGPVHLGKIALQRVAPSGSVAFAHEITNASTRSYRAADIEVALDGRIYVAGSHQLDGENVAALSLQAFDGNGVSLWLRRITGHQQSFGGGAGAFDLELDAFGRVVVLGFRAQGGQGSALVLATYDTLGNQVWQRIVNDVLGGPSLQRWVFGSELFLSPSGEAITVGRQSLPLDDTASDAFALGIDALGETRFAYTYGFPTTPQGYSFDAAYGGANVPGNGFVMVGQALGDVANGDAFIARWSRTAIAYCFGDGASTACPCGNASAPVERAGCATSFGVGGRLADLGRSSITDDTLVLRGTAMPNSSALYFQGTSTIPPIVFGDGLRCAGGTTVRLKTQTNAGGASQFPAQGDVPVSVAGAVLVPGERTYQVWFRNAASFCTSAAYNLTNGLRVTWTL